MGDDLGLLHNPAVIELIMNSAEIKFKASV